ncbi:MAG TPA: glycoside hydrolase family 9 protein [Victivallales bacterium]|nr:glycoside hydrolase family 9 protein [Victivallales bacterium]
MKKILLLLFSIFTMMILKGFEIDNVHLANKDILSFDIIDGKCIFNQKDGTGKIEGATVNPSELEKSNNYILKCPGETNSKITLIQIGRKSKGSQFVKSGEWKFEPRYTHTLYLRFSQPFKDKEKYQITVKNPATGCGDKSIEFIIDFKKMRSESIHISQIGFLPETAKRGFLSCWAGTMGAIDFSEAAKTGFEIVDKNGNSAYKGRLVLRRRADETGDDAYKNNFQGCDLYEFDFSDLRTPGEYRAVIPGIGCSFPFKIGNDVFANAYKTTVKGLYYQRCGCVLEPKHAGIEWARNRCHHPADGKKIEETNLPLTECSMGWGTLNQFQELPKRTTGKNLQFWGGWHDAGDWDRRSQHMYAASYLIDVTMLFPGVFKDGELNIPESGNGIPDIIDEAKWCLDFFKRGQEPDGGIKGGIESENHPVPGTQSWNDPLHLYAYAADPLSSYLFAWSASKLSRALKNFKKSKDAEEYLKAAEKAFEWAEKNGGEKYNDQRNAVAAELFATTEKESYHDIFKITSVWTRNPASSVKEYKKHDQQAGAYSYVACVPQEKTDKKLRELIVAALVKQADEWVATAEKRAFRFSGNLWRPMNWGLGSIPDVDELIAGYAAKKDPQYIEAIASSCAWTLGGNPLNMVWVSGLGTKRVTQVLHHDSWFMADGRGIADVVPGLVPGGPTAFKNQSKGIHGFSQRSFQPPMKNWPIAEQYAGNRYDPGMNEHTPNMIAEAAVAYAFMYAVGKK